jgi:O-acetyl-ADP-ribose deacetylase (regulator of RNase III)
MSYKPVDGLKFCHGESRTVSERILIVKGDITKQKVDAIVNAANHTLLGGGGVDGAIHAAAGPQLLEECRTLGGCATGEAKITNGYELPAAWIIHTVGPVWSGGLREEDKALANCYRSSLRLAKEYGIPKLAFPSISTGAYRFPVGRAARIAVREIAAFLKASQIPEEVRVVCFDQGTYDAYAAALDAVEGRPGKGV